MDVRARLEEVLPQRYRIERELAHGGMAVVYLAQDLQVPHKVAIKVLSPELALAVKRERFLREIETVSRLTHPHIVSVFDSGGERDCLYYVMEYVEGETLADRIARAGPLPVAEALGITRVVADALAYAHEQGVIHRDIKPGNILLSVSGHAWVADFGIARAVGTSGDSSVTATGVQLGTPAYMSPEQLTTGAVLDGRSDIYSLGCVLFEMLTGRPPFVGPSLQSIMTQHLTDPPPSVRSLRRDVPPGIQRVVTRALAKQPADRFVTAAELRDALDRGDVAYPGPWRALSAAARRWSVAVGSLAAVGIAAWLMLRAPGPDPSVYALVPFAHQGDSVPALLNGEHCQLRLYDALKRWKDLRLVDLFQMRDLFARRATGAPTLGIALDLARAARAGRLIWGYVSRAGDGLEIRAALYAVDRRGSARILAEKTVQVDSGLTNLDSQILELTQGLLQGNTQVAETAGGSDRTNVIGALWAFDSGYAALVRWDQERAEALFRRAMVRDPHYSYASLWLGHLMSLRGDSEGAWVEHARAAMLGASKFRWSDSVLAGALLAMAERRFQDACGSYQQLVARDSTSFWGWLGLGDCRARDSLVVPDPRSRSRWSFRSSYHAAAQAFERALEVIPSVSILFRGPAFDRLTKLFYIETHRLRGGFAPGAGDTLWFRAYASLEPDTLGFVPYPSEDVARVVAGLVPATFHAAVEGNRDRLRRITATWVRAFPNSPDAHETLARFLETVGDLGEAGARERSALATIREARRWATDSTQELRLAAAEARVAIKLGDFARAKTVADSVLDDAAPARSGETTRLLAGLAVLTGRAQRAIQVLALDAPEQKVRTPAGAVIPVRPLQLAQAMTLLQVYAALGAPAESIATAARRAGDLIEIWVDARQRPTMREAILDQPQWWAYPALGAKPVEPGRASTYVQELHWALERRDVATIRLWFERLRELRTGFRPGEVAIHHTYHEARVLLGIGDTAAATTLLDNTLQALPTLGSSVLRELPQAAGLVRTMVLRAELADRAGDVATARRWAGPVALLWGEADVPALRAVADSMRVLSRRRG